MITVTYSPAFTLVPTYECFNRCSYCHFRSDPGSPWISLEKATTLLQSLRDQGICELLILSGEVHPDSPRRSAWLQHILNLCHLAADQGFLPHTNVGLLRRSEMEHLKSINASMGLMLEQITPKLQATVHRHAPSKDPTLRLHQLEQAGILNIPFTTGLLLGIGETETDRMDTLQAIAQIHRCYGHIQEVILQPHRSAPPAQPLSWQQTDAEQDRILVQTVHLARQILPPEITLQIPPNLTNVMLDCLAAGARDLGGIGPHDHVNPDYPHPDPADLKTLLASHGYALHPRLPIYPAYASWIPASLQPQFHHWTAVINPIEH